MTIESHALILIHIRRANSKSQQADSNLRPSIFGLLHIWKLKRKTNKEQKVTGKSTDEPQIGCIEMTVLKTVDIWIFFAHSRADKCNAVLVFVMSQK